MLPDTFVTKTSVRHPRIHAILCFLLFAADIAADPNVVVVAWADDAYTERKFEHDPPRVESFVVMQGWFFEGATRDRSLTKLSFRSIAESLAAELAQDNFVPASDVESADLLLLVHWGTTSPRVTFDTLRGTTTFGIKEEAHAPGEVSDIHSPDDPASQFFVDQGEKYRDYGFQENERLGDSFDDDLRNASNARLLGYTALIRNLAKSPGRSTMEDTLRFDLETERYFIIVKAYDLKAPREPGIHKKPVWTLHMNMRSPGQNFGTAVARMSSATADFAGRTSLDRTTVAPNEHRGKVTVGPLKVIGIAE